MQSDSPPDSFGVVAHNVGAGCSFLLGFATASATQTTSLGFAGDVLAFVTGSGNASASAAYDDEGGEEYSDASATNTLTVNFAVAVPIGYALQAELSGPPNAALRIVLTGGQGTVEYLDGSGTYQVQGDLPPGDYTLSVLASAGAYDNSHQDPYTESVTCSYSLELLPARIPVFILPGIGGTYSSDLNDLGYWLFNRGIEPAGMQIDPLAFTYADLIQTLRNVGYIEGEDLFVTNFDWRVVPGPSDGIYDGFISGITAASITDNVFDYGVDYLGLQMKGAMDAWEENHPGETLEEIDVIAHSTGGLVARTYIESPAYGGIFAGDRKLPKIRNLVMIGVPNRGAAKVWNPLQDNWRIDVSFKLVLSKIVNLAYQKVLVGATIYGPDGIIDEATLNGPGCVTSPERCFILKYAPTIRSLLATYDFIDNGSGLQNLNSDPAWRNELILDLNAGLDLAPAADGNAFCDSAHVTVIYGTNVDTPVTTVRHVGEVGGENMLYPFAGYAEGDAGPTDVWFEDVFVPEHGDGTVPLESSVGQFVGDPRVTLVPFTKGVNTSGDVSHGGLVSNREVLSYIMGLLGNEFDAEDISTDEHGPLANIKDVLPSIACNILGGNLAVILFDPVDGFLVDGLGRRLGTSAATGVLTEIPGSIWTGDEDGLGWVVGPLEGPLTLQLSGLGGDHYTAVTTQAEAGDDGLVASGFLGQGEVLVLDVPLPGEPSAVPPATPPARAVAALFGARPDPIRGSTTVRFELSAPQAVEIAVYNVKGQKVEVLAQGQFAAGSHGVRWDAAPHASGIYFVRLTAGTAVATRKVTLVR